MIIDIGGGTTDIAVLSLGGKVKATSVRVAGNHYDEEILKFVRNKLQRCHWPAHRRRTEKERGLLPPED